MFPRAPTRLAASWLTPLCLWALATGCGSSGPTGLLRTPAGPGAAVRFDVFHRPLADIPLPNDFATRFDSETPTHRRLNVSLLAPSVWEQKVRAQLDLLDGWGTLAPISVSFEAPLDVENIIRRHGPDRLDARDDVMLVIDVTQASPDFCQAMPIDLGEGHFPILLDRADYYPDDPHAPMKQLLFEEVEEDLNHNGVLDPGEDTDMDGVLDHPNTRSATDSTILSFYERETNTLIAKPVMPLREATTYAVVLTRALLDAEGHSVRSPFTYVNHAAQTPALQVLPGCLSRLGLGVDDVAFTWSFTTQSWTPPFIAARDGLYGLGPLARLATQFPAEMKLADLRARGSSPNLKIVPGDVFLPMAKDLYSKFGSGQTDAQGKLFFDSFGFVDFHALGTIDSPQFFPRLDADGHLLPLSDQVWQLDPKTGDAFTRHEGVTFWLMVPKHRRGPAPVAIFIHGHGSNKFDALNVAGFLARYGIATLGIDAVSHGVDIDPLLLEIVKGEFKANGIEGMGTALIAGRALDQNADGKLDSGADYWTAYAFHTRDVVRQTAVDVMQVVRVLKSFDGQRHWRYDANNDGVTDLAGDFDGDGTVDVGGTAPIHLLGGSLGGILSSFIAGLEPQIEAAVPIIGGGGLSEIGTRSSLGGVRDAMVLRMMGPLLLVHDGALFEAFPDLTDYKEVKIAPVDALKPGTVAVLENLDTREYRCARVQPNGHLRVAVPSDQGNQLRLSFYDSELPTKLLEGCEPTGTPARAFDTFSEAFVYAGQTFAAGAPLVALGDGFGLKRGSPELRRMVGIAQLALEGADPANSAPFIHQDRTLTYGTKETVSSRVFYINTLGDPGVPTASGVTMARAAGLIDFRSVDPRYGKSVQQELIDLGTVEGVDGTKRYTNAAGEGVFIDVDNLANLVAPPGDGFDAPRLTPPLRVIRQNNAAVGGKSAILFPMMDPHGVHGFPLPSPDKAFDLGSLLLNQACRYLSSHGEELDFDPCQLTWSCPWIPPPAP